VSRDLQDRLLSRVPSAKSCPEQPASTHQQGYLLFRRGPEAKPPDQTPRDDDWRRFTGGGFQDQSGQQEPLWMQQLVVLTSRDIIDPRKVADSINHLPTEWVGRIELEGIVPPGLGRLG
jgi:hypothetical protein